jgi:hypothetical protein
MGKSPSIHALIMTSLTASWRMADLRLAELARMGWDIRAR